MISHRERKHTAHGSALYKDSPITLDQPRCYSKKLCSNLKQPQSCNFCMQATVTFRISLLLEIMSVRKGGPHGYRFIECLEKRK